MKRIFIAVSVVVLVFTASVLIMSFPSGEMKESRLVAFPNVPPLESPMVFQAGVLTVTPFDGLTSTGNVGGPFNPASIVYTLQNTGGAQIYWAAGGTQPWITVSLPKGILPPGAAAKVTVSINSSTNSLTPGTYTGTVNFRNSTNESGTTTRPVNLMVTSPAGKLEVAPVGGLNSTGPEGGPFNPASIVYTLQNPGASPINWTASIIRDDRLLLMDNFDWLALSSAQGTLVPGTTVAVTVSINGSEAQKLGEATHTATVTFTNTTNGSGNTTRPVSLTVSATPGVLQVGPSGAVDLEGTAGGPVTPDLSYTLQNTGGSPINWTAANTQPWLTLSPLQGTLAQGATTQVTGSFKTGSLPAPALYSDTLTFTNITNGSGTTTRSVRLNLFPPPGMLTVTPSNGLTSTGKAGGPFKTSSIIYTLQNTGGSPVDWSASTDQPWITISLVKGTLAVAASVTVTVSINSSATKSLLAGAHTATVVFGYYDERFNTWKTTTWPVSLTLR